MMIGDRMNAEKIETEIPNQFHRTLWTNPTGLADGSSGESAGNLPLASIQPISRSVN
jgi:hypothetical protein